MAEQQGSKMEQPFESVMQSQCFTFIIGQHATSFFAHAGAWAKLSPALEKFINEQCHENRVVLENLDTETFILVCEYAYTQDYTTPTPAKRPDGDTGQEDVAFHLASAASATENSSETPSESFDKATGVKIPPNEPDENYGPVLLVQGKLYSFANQWGIEALKYLVLRRLEITLKGYNLNRSSLEDVVGLIEFIFWKGGIPEEDPLRDVILDYVKSKAGMFTANENFMNLLGEGGNFVKELWRKLFAGRVTFSQG